MVTERNYYLTFKNCLDINLLRYFKQLNSSDWIDFFDDYYNNHISFLSRILKSPKGENIQSYGMVHLIDVDSNSHTLISNANDVLLAQYFNEKKWDTLRELFSTARFLKLNISVNILSDIILNNSLNKEIRELSAITLSVVHENSLIPFWDSINLRQNEFLIPAYILFFEKIDPLKGLEKLVQINKMPDDVDAFETPILYNLIQVSNSIGDIEKYKKLRKRFPEWANDLISDLFEDYPELMALKKHLESIGLSAFSTGTYDIIEKSVERKITSQIFDTRDDEIRAFFEPNNWKTLVDIIIRRIKSGFITEEKFYLIGFVFAEMESMYQDEIKKHLNSHYCAYSEGEFHFMTEDGSFHRWEIKIELNLMINYFYNFEDFTPKLQI